MSTAVQITNICDFVNPNDSEILDSDTSVRWFDNKKVDTTSSYVGLGEGGEAERWHKKKGKKIKIGGASYLASQGFSDLQIRQAGRWSSSAYLSYIRINH